MSIPRPVVEAVRFKNERTMECLEDAEARARRVILALVESLPDSTVEKAVLAWLDEEQGWTASEIRSMQWAMRTAIAAALKDVAGETQ